MEVQQQTKIKAQSLHTLKIVDGKYQVKQKVLGEGSFATTYLAIDTKTNAVLACKMISKKHLIGKINLSKNKTLTKQYFIGALKNQVKTWKSLHHKNVVEFIDFSETANNIYFFLEYCSGGNLESTLKKRGFLSQEEAAPILYQLISGCAYLYDLGIFHRDLKPENILIAGSGIMKISDFGFAKVLEEQELKDHPVAQTCVGTPIYMSPQVLLGNPYTIKCDVWSLGVMFYKILYGMIPWEHTDNIAILTQKMKQNIQFPPNIGVDNWLKDLIKGMLQTQQSGRLSIKDVKNIFSAHYGAMDSE